MNDQKPLSKHLKSALRKLQHFNGDVWRGYLIPMEILALVKDGAKDTNGANLRVMVAEKRKLEGNTGGTWFYCTLGKHSPIEKKK